MSLRRKEDLEDTADVYNWSPSEVKKLFTKLLELQGKINRCIEQQQEMYRLFDKVTAKEKKFSKSSSSHDTGDNEDARKPGSSPGPNSPTSVKVMGGRVTRSSSNAYTKTTNTGGRNAAVLLHRLAEAQESSSSNFDNEPLPGMDDGFEIVTTEEGQVKPEACYGDDRDEDQEGQHLMSDVEEGSEEDSFWDCPPKNKTSVIAGKGSASAKSSGSKEGSLVNTSCTHCGYKGLSKWHLTRHMLAIHGIGIPYKCKGCGDLFNSYKRYTAHKKKCAQLSALQGKPTPKVKTSTKVKVTGLGSETLSEMKDNNRHVTYVAGDEEGGQPLFQCKLCDELSDQRFTPQEIGQHYDMEHMCSKTSSGRAKGSEGKSCPICLKQFSMTWHMKRHMASVHRIGKAMKCEICGKEFMVLHSFQRHYLKLHKGIPPPLPCTPSSYECEICGKSFTFWSLFVTHLKRVHQESKVANADAEAGADSNNVQDAC